jgi:hypothetical protein
VPCVTHPEPGTSGPASTSVHWPATWLSATGGRPRNEGDRVRGQVLRRPGPIRQTPRPPDAATGTDAATGRRRDRQTPPTRQAGPRHLKSPGQVAMDAPAVGTHSESGCERVRLTQAPLWASGQYGWLAKQRWYRHPDGDGGRGPPGRAGRLPLDAPRSGSPVRSSTVAGVKSCQVQQRPGQGARRVGRSSPSRAPLRIHSLPSATYEERTAGSDR